MRTADLKIEKFLLAISAAPFVLFMRILSPLVIVRIFVLDLGRIGSVLPNFDTYICRRKTGLNGSRIFDICCFKRGKIANSQVKKMVERTIPIYPLAYWVDKVNKRIPGWEKHVVPRVSRLNCELARTTTTVLSFTPDELEFGREELAKLGLPNNRPYICFHARDAVYLKTHQPGINWDYHSYRNADIDQYVPAVERLVSKGYFAIRMGRFVAKKIKTDHPQIIDYAAMGGTDFLDMYLSAHCRFFIAGSDGLAEVPTIFRRPVVWIDFVPFSAVYLVTAGQLFIPKRLWSSKENRMLTFDEMLNTEIAEYGRTEDFQKGGIEVINNSPEEIIDVAIEMEERLKGTWVETEEDRRLQERFHEIVADRKGRNFFGSIGAKFLRQNQNLLKLAEVTEKAIPV